MHTQMLHPGEGPAEMPAPQLSYYRLPLSAVAVSRAHRDPAGVGSRLAVTVELEGERFHATDRFWSSFFARFGISGSIFRYYDHQEVFDRIASRVPGVELRFCTEQSDQGFGRALAVSNPQKPVISPSICTELLTDARGERVQYHNGVMTSSHTPASGAKMLNIGGDAIRNQFTLQVPLDGYGDPSIYLSILRQVCLNGMVAMTSAFRSDVKVGDDPIYSVRRALATFDNEEGFGAIHQRLEAAQGSPASLREARGLHNVVKNLDVPGLMNRYDAVVGDLCGYYGVANLDAISAKKLRLLPARSCRVYDLINLASEIATHHMRTGEHVVNGPKALHGWIGTTICDEYDLEGTANANQDFRDLFLRC